MRLSTVKTVPSPFWIFYHKNKSQRQSQVSCTHKGRWAPQRSQPPDSGSATQTDHPGVPAAWGGDRCPQAPVYLNLPTRCPGPSQVGQQGLLVEGRREGQVAWASRGSGEGP